MSQASHSVHVTAEQLASFPDDGQRRELVYGVVRMMSPAGGRHGQVAHRLGRLLGNHVEPNGLGAVFAAETGFLLSRNPDTVRAPDVAFVKQERLATIEDLSGYVSLAPDLVAEVISPSDRFFEVEEKAWSWINSGVIVVILVDPENRRMHIYRQPNVIMMLDENSELVVEDVVPGWRLKVAEVMA